MALLESLNSAFSGLQQYQNELDVVGNNIANSNTPGFKFARTTFEDAFSNTIAVGDGTTSTAQIGTGVGTSAVTNIFTSGTLTSTGVASDLAINGEGFFIVKDPVSGQEFATRAGDFTRDTSGYLVTSKGLRLQGFSDGGTTRGDIRIDATGAPATAAPTAAYDRFSVSPNGDGKINVTLTDGTTFVRGQVLLQNFTTPSALTKLGQNLYSNLAAAGPLGTGGSASAVTPGSSGTGMIEGFKLEMSNVDLTREFSSMINTQRAFQANARMVTTSDEVLQELVNLKR